MWNTYLKNTAAPGACKEIPQGDLDPSSVCSNTWFEDQCLLREIPLALTFAPSMVLEAADSYTITWTGGKRDAKVFIKFELTTTDGSGISDGGKEYTGFGIPSEAVANDGTHEWVVEAGILTSDQYKIVLVSSSDPTNTIKSASYFSVDGTLKNYHWSVSEFGTCSQECMSNGQVGTQSRTVNCVLVKSSGSTESAPNSKCKANGKPTTSGACGTQQCVACPNVPGMYVVGGGVVGAVCGWDCCLLIMANC